MIQRIFLCVRIRGKADGGCSRIRQRATAGRLFHSSRRTEKECGIVGLPNVGKSLLFNALLGREAAESKNYPFCTIKPNTGLATIIDPKLHRVAESVKAQKIVPAQVEYVDIAGLVEGASEGRGLGNQFLESIRHCQIIIQLVRCFDDPMIVHVEASVDPVRDIQIIQNELIMKDLQLVSILRRRKPKGTNFDDKKYLALADKVIEVLEAGKMANSLKVTDDAELEILNSWRLLSAKPNLIVCNVDESSAAAGNKYTKAVQQYIQEDGGKRDWLHVCAKLEAEAMIFEDDPVKRKDIYMTYGMQDSALTTLINKTFSMLGMICYYTAGVREARAWPIALGTTARKAAGEIHTDMEKGFIKAETIAYDAFIAGSRKARLEGPNYVVQDGDVLTFRFKSDRLK